MKTTRFFALFLMLGLGVFMVMLALPVHAQEDDTTDDQTYVQGCAECHIDTVLDWQTGPHAMSFSSPAFQDAYAQNQDDSCLICHTTGFEAYSGEFTHAAITCEACHGETPVNHPDEPMLVINGLETCATCHTPTFREWENSPHGAADQNMPCTTCHNPHPQQIRFESNNALCLNCHETDTREDYAHITHVEQECTNCHWHRGEFDVETHSITGELTSTGHEGDVDTLACIDCHESEGDTILTSSPQADGLTLRVRIEELEAEVQSVRAQGENTSAVRLIQGLVVGIAFGAVLLFGTIRLQVGKVKEKDDHDGSTE